MVQVAAALLFVVAAGFGIIVIVAMLKTNANAILSALLGEGAFPIAPAPRPGPALALTLRRSADRHETPRPVRVAGRPAALVSRAA